MRLEFCAGMLIVFGVFILPTSAAEPEVGVTGKNAPSFAIFDRGMIALLKQTEVPGGALAVAKNGRIVYNRGFGYADRDKKEPVLPSSLFRIASISKPLTAVAVLQLVEKNKLKLDDKVFDILKLEEPKGVTFDARWKTVTILELLQHTGGWDSDASFDPMFRSPSIVDELKIKAPADQRAIIRYMLRKPLQFDPGTQHHYSNFGYCLLGRVIEKVSDRSYKDYVQENVLAPLGIDKMRLGKTLLNDRAENEVRYYTANDNKQTAILGPDLGKPVLAPYGGWNLEAMDAHGGWLATAEDLVRFSSAFDNPKKCKILSEKSIAIMYARPEGAPGMDKDGKPSASYYGCGWYVRVVQPGKVTLWHSGSTEGTSTELVRRQEGLTWVTWAVLFNSRDTPTKKQPIELIGKLLHEAADSVKQWPR